MGWASLYILYVYINSKVAKKIGVKFILHKYKMCCNRFYKALFKTCLLWGKKKVERWPNLTNIRENGWVVDEHKGFISGK